MRHSVTVALLFSVINLKNNAIFLFRKKIIWGKKETLMVPAWKLGSCRKGVSNLKAVAVSTLFFFYTTLKFYRFSSYQYQNSSPCVSLCVLEDYVIVCDFQTPGSFGWQALAKNRALNFFPSRGQFGCGLASAHHFHESHVSFHPSQSGLCSYPQGHKLCISQMFLFQTWAQHIEKTRKPLWCFQISWSIIMLLFL